MNRLQTSYPSGRMILPEFRQRLVEQKNKELLYEKTQQPLYDEQHLQEFQSLLEQSLRDRLVIRIITFEAEKKTTTTGIVTRAVPQTGKIEVQTIEGERVLHAGNIRRISEC
jgi:hypothetical protein